MSFLNAGKSAILYVIKYNQYVTRQEWNAAHKAANEIFSSVACSSIHTALTQVQ